MYEFRKQGLDNNFGIHRESILRIDLMIRLKGGRNHFLGQNWTQKSQNCPKSISRKPLVAESCSALQNDRKT